MTRRAESVADDIRHHIKCKKCGKWTERALSWFAGKHVLACEGCGCPIDLGPHRARIEAELRVASDVQAALIEAGGGAPYRPKRHFDPVLRQF